MTRYFAPGSTQILFQVSACAGAVARRQAPAARGALVPGEHRHPAIVQVDGPELIQRVRQRRREHGVERRAVPRHQQGLAGVLFGGKGEKIAGAFQRALQALRPLRRTIGLGVSEKASKRRAQGVGVFALVGAKGDLGEALVRADLLPRPAADQLRGVHRTSQRAGIHRIKMHAGQTLPGLHRLTAARLVQRDVGAPLQHRAQVPVGLAVPDEIQLCLWQKKALFR